VVLLVFAALISIPMSAAAKGGGKGKGKTLIVSQRNGTVDFGDPCPSPRTAAKYLDVQTAVDCALEGDTIKIRPGAYSNWPAGQEEPNGVQVSKSLNLVGSGIHQTVLKTSNVGIGLPEFPPTEERIVVRISNMTLASADVAGPGEGTCAILCISRSARVYARGLLLSAVSGVPLAGFAGAVENRFGYLELDQCQIVGNTTVLGGPAVYTWRDSYTRIKRSSIVNNVSQTGLGAIYNDGKMDIFKSLVTANRGGGIVNYGTIKLRGSVVELNQGFDCIGCP
jgi:hypothetical protein